MSWKLTGKKLTREYEEGFSHCDHCDARIEVLAPKLMVTGQVDGKYVSLEFCDVDCLFGWSKGQVELP